MPLTRAIPEHIGGDYDDALYKSTFTLLYFTTAYIQKKVRQTLNILHAERRDVMPPADE